MVHRPSWDVGMAEMSYSLPDSCLLTTHPHPSAPCSCQFSQCPLGKEKVACTSWWISGQGMGCCFPYFACSFFYRQALINTLVFYKPTGLEESIFKRKPWSLNYSSVLTSLPPSASIWMASASPSKKQFLFFLLPWNQMLSKPAWLLFKPFS